MGKLKPRDYPFDKTKTDHDEPTPFVNGEKAEEKEDQSHILLRGSSGIAGLSDLAGWRIICERYSQTKYVHLCTE